MSAAAPVMVRSWKVGHRNCTMALQRPEPGEAVHALFVWDPSVPAKLSDEELQQYRAGRDAAMAEIAEALQVTVAVVDL